MKKLINIAIICLFLSSCAEDIKRQHLEEVAIATQHRKRWGGNHILRKIASEESVESNFRGSYFLIAGSVSGETKTVSKITFAWLNNDGDYEFMNTIIDKIKVHINDSINQPYIKFNMNAPDKAAYQEIESITIYCKDSDFPKDLKINEL